MVGYDGDYSDYEDYADWYREQKEEADQVPASGEFAQWLKDAEKRFPPTLRLPEYDRRERLRKRTIPGGSHGPARTFLEER